MARSDFPYKISIFPSMVTLVGGGGVQGEGVSFYGCQPFECKPVLVPPRGPLVSLAPALMGKGEGVQGPSPVVPGLALVDSGQAPVIPGRAPVDRGRALVDAGLVPTKYSSTPLHGVSISLTLSLAAISKGTNRETHAQSDPTKERLAMCSQGAISTTAEASCQNVCTTLPRGPWDGTAIRHQCWFACIVHYGVQRS